MLKADAFNLPGKAKEQNKELTQFAKTFTEVEQDFSQQRKSNILIFLHYQVTGL